MAGLSLSGLASGMDTDSVISQLMAIEAQSKVRLQGRQYRAEQTKSVLNEVASKLRGLKTAADDLKSVTAWSNVQTVASSDASKMTARFVSGAAVGSFSVEVVSLARADQRFYDMPTAPATATQLDINGVKIDIAAGATQDQIATAINGKAESPAFASVVGGQLVLSGKKTNVVLNVNVGATSLAEDGTKYRAAAPATFRVDGQPAAPATLTSDSNTVTNALPGVELTFKSLGTASIEVGAPGPDQDALKSKVKAFVDAYNSTLDLLKAKTEEKRVASPVLRSDYGKGVLRSDPALVGLMSSMRQFVSEIVPTGTSPANPTDYDQLSDIGITGPPSSASREDRLLGKLVIDDAKLTAAIQADPVAVRRLFGGVTDTPGLAQGFATLIDPVAGVTDGSIAARVTSTDREVASLADQMTQFDARMKLKEERLRKQFTAMEQALSNTQNSTNWLSGQIAGLASWN